MAKKYELQITITNKAGAVLDNIRYRESHLYLLEKPINTYPERFKNVMAGSTDHEPWTALKSVHYEDVANDVAIELGYADLADLIRDKAALGNISGILTHLETIAELYQLVNKHAGK